MTLVLLVWYQHKKISALGFPQKYKTRVLIATLLMYGAMLFFVIIL